MSLLSIITEACQSSGMEAPASAIGSTDPTVQKMVQFSIETVEELRRRHGWSRLVDAVNGARQLDEHHEALEQAAVAARLLISKTALAEITASANAATAATFVLMPGQKSSRLTR